MSDKKVFNIGIELDADFVDCLNELIENSSHELAVLNGFAPEQLNYTGFIDKFLANDTVADASIDGNSNVHHHDVVTMEHEMVKPHEKVLSFNKLFYELKKKYGLEDAKRWLKDEWNGRMYLHDGYNASLKQYCLSGETEFITDEGVKTLREMCGKDVNVLNINRGWEHGVVKCFGEDRLYDITLKYGGATKHVYATGNHRWFIYEGRHKEVVSTLDLKPGDRIPFNTDKTFAHVKASSFGVAHGFFTGDGFKAGHRANFCGDKIALLPYFQPCNIGGNEREYTVHGCPNYFSELPPITENKAYLYGWLSGFFAADGCMSSDGNCLLTSCNYEYIKFARDVIAKLGMAVNNIREQSRISNLTGEEGKVYFLYLNKECLQEDFFIRPFHKENFIKWKENRKIESRRYWIVCSVEATDRIEPVYCVETDKTGSFTLAGNVLTHNCFAIDIDSVARRGLFFLENYNAEPPKHFTTFNQMVVETVSYLSNRQSGAVGLPSYLVWAWWFWWKDCNDGFYLKNPDYYRDQCLQEIVYRLNQPFLRNSIESAFTNFSVFDRPYFEAFFGGLEFPDGTFAIDHEEDIIQFEKDFMELEAKIRSNNMMTYPVLSFSMQRINGKFVDEEFARWACKFNMLWNDSNFLVTEEITSAASCCFTGDTEVLWRSTDAGVNRSTFEEVWDEPKSRKHNFKVFHNGSWVEATPIRLPSSGHKMYKIVLANKKELVVTDNHLFPTLYGDVRADEISENDYIMCSSRQLNRVNEASTGYNGDAGYLLGAYLGDGCRTGGASKFSITLSINSDKYERGFNRISRGVQEIDENATIKVRDGQHNVVSVVINSEKVYNFIFSHMSGFRAEVKSINMNCLLESVSFRSGVIDGLYDTDGGNSNRIYTSSHEMAKDIETILTSLGKFSIIDCSDRTDEAVVIRGQSFNRNFPLWCVRFYSDTNKRNFKDVYKTVNNSTYFKVVSVKEVEYSDDYVYCFEMKNQEEPYFTLPNGVVTHNCRLVSDVTNVDKDVPLGVCNSIGGTSLNVGSVKVNTVNLARMAYESENIESYINKVYEQTIVACKLLDVQRHTIKRNIEKGLLPNFTSGLLNMDRMFSTVGVIGIYEACEHFNLITKDQFGYVHYSAEARNLGSRIFDTIHKAQDDFKAKNHLTYQFNVEQIPKMCGDKVA